MEKRAASTLEIIDCFHIIIRPTDIEPIACVGVDVDLLSLRQQVQHQFVESVLSAGRDELQNGLAHHVQSHAHKIAAYRLLLESNQMRFRICMKNAVIGGLFASRRGDCEETALRDMLSI